jgi:hypothetical protein
VRYCPTEQMLADFFTKPLQGSLFRRLRAVIMGHEHVDTLLSPVPPTSQERVEHNTTSSKAVGSSSGDVGNTALTDGSGTNGLTSALVRVRTGVQTRTTDTTVGTSGREQKKTVSYVDIVKGKGVRRIGKELSDVEKSVKSERHALLTLKK